MPTKKKAPAKKPAKKAKPAVKVKLKTVARQQLDEAKHEITAARKQLDVLKKARESLKSDLDKAQVDVEKVIYLRSYLPDNADPGQHPIDAVIAELERSRETMTKLADATDKAKAEIEETLQEDGSSALDLVVEVPDPETLGAEDRPLIKQRSAAFLRDLAERMHNVAGGDFFDQGDTSTMEEIAQQLDGIEQRYGGKDPLQAQVNRLATFIMTEVPGEPSENEGAIDTAIRVMGRLLKPAPTTTETPEAAEPATTSAAEAAPTS